MQVALVATIGFCLWAIIQLPPDARLATAITLNFAIGLVAAIVLKRPLATIFLGGLFAGAVFCDVYILIG